MVIRTIWRVGTKAVHLLALPGCEGCDFFLRLQGPSLSFFLPPLTSFFLKPLCSISKAASGRMTSRGRARLRNKLSGHKAGLDFALYQVVVENHVVCFTQQLLRVRNCASVLDASQLILLRCPHVTHHSRVRSNMEAQLDLRSNGSDSCLQQMQASSSSLPVVGLCCSWRDGNGRSLS